MTKNKNQVIQSSNYWDRQLVTTAREFSVTNQDSFDLSYSDEFMGNPFRSVHLNYNQNGLFNYDKYVTANKLDAIHELQ